MNIIEFSIFYKKWKKYVKKLKKVVNMVLEDANEKNCYLKIFLVDDGEIRKINFLHRDRDEATDVLSFPVWNSYFKERIYAGDIVLSYNYIKNMAKNEKYFKKAILNIIIHGTLHILGHDHKNELEAKKMFDLETKFLSLYGYLGRFYAE